MEYRNISVTISTNAGAFAGQMAQAGTAVSTFGTKLQAVEAGFARAGRTLTSAGKMMTAAITLPLAAIGVASVRAFANFNAAMTESLAIMGEVSGPMAKQMEEAARDIGRTTKFSATEAAESYFFLASAGLDATQSIQALPQVAQFAQAGMFDMSKATDLLTDAQSALGLSSDDAAENLENMARVSDVLVGANTLANASVEQFATSLTQKAATAMKTFGIELEDGVAVLAAFADAGIKGEQAGTFYSRTLEGLAENARKNKEAFEEFNIAVFDSEGVMRPTAEVVRDMEAAFEGMTIEQKEAAIASLGFNKLAKQGLLLLMGNSDAVDGYADSLREMGGITEEVADKQMVSFNAQAGLLKDRLVDIGISIGQALAPTLSRFVDFLGSRAIPSIENMVNAFVSLPQGVQSTVIAMAGLAAAIGPVLLVMGGIATAISRLIPLWASMAAATKFVGPLSTNIRLVGPALMAMAGSLTTAAGAARALGLAMKGALVFFAFDHIIGGAVRAKQSLNDLKTEAEAVGGAFKGLPNEVDLLTAEIARQERALDALGSQYEGTGILKALFFGPDMEHLEATKQHEAAIHGLKEALSEAKTEAEDTAGSMTEYANSMELGSEKTLESSNAADLLAEAAERAASAQEEHASATESSTAALADSTSAYGIWVNQVLPAYESVMDSAERLTAAIEGQSVSTFEGLQLQGDALASFTENFTEAYRSATDMLSAFAGESAVTSQQILQHYQDQQKAVENWHSNLMILAEEIGDTGPGKALLQEMTEAGPEMAPVLQGLIDAIKDGNIEAILASREAIDDLMNQTISDVNGKAPEMADAAGTWGSGMEAALKPALEQIRVDLDQIDATNVKPSAGLVADEFNRVYENTLNFIDNLDSQKPKPILDGEPGPFNDVYNRTMAFIENLANQKPTPTLDAQPAPFDGKIRNAMQALDIITGRTGLPTIDSHDGPFHSKAAGVHQQIGVLGGLHARPTVSVNDQASATIAMIQRQLNFITGTYTAVVKAVQGKHEGGPIYHSGGSIGPISTMHDGGLRPDERMIKAQTGEFMFQRSAVQGLGVDLLREMNQTGAIPWSRFVDAQGGAQGTRMQSENLRSELSGLAESIRSQVQVKSGDTIINVRAVPDLRKKDMGTTRLINEIKEALDGKMEAMK